MFSASRRISLVLGAGVMRMCCSNKAALANGVQAVSVNFGGGCPSACSGHGYCTNPGTESCKCHQGWTGGDCSIRLCPSANAWVDYATDDNVAHASLTECSGMGVCDRSTGRCLCRSGFTGEACQRLTCPNDCSKRGRCMSMRDAAAVVDGEHLNYQGVYDEWDADMIFGCLCDEGWEGPDCSLRSCPLGVDPYPYADGTSEEQLIDCLCFPHCTGSLTLGYRGHTTRPLPWDSSAELVKHRLEELDTIQEVFVNVTGSGRRICSGSTGATTGVIFVLEHGALPNMTVDAANLASTSGIPSVMVISKGQASNLYPHLQSRVGTKILQECSGRGYCNRDTGHCSCYTKFLSSNGKGSRGDLGDCGYFDPSDPPTNCSTALPLWGDTEAVCSGAGNCDMATMRCNCTEGLAGGACEKKECGSNTAWFEEGAWNSTSGAAGGRSGRLIPCSSGGICDEATGNCTCRSGIYAGNDCSVMACPTCHGVGVCRDMVHFAAMASSNGELTPYTYDLWDATKMRSCWCNRTKSVGTEFSGTSTTYRGPYSLADTDSQGYDCSLDRCPTGDHMYTPGVTDIQRVNCTGGAGVFSLSFRDAATEEVDYDATAEEFERALEATPWILDVKVTFVNGTYACNETEYILVEFLTENGDLPLMKPDATRLFHEDYLVRGNVSVTKVQTGTREDVECAAHGICREQEGICDCFVGYQSSDGRGGVGQRGDCGWRNKYQTALFRGDGTAHDYN